MERDAFFVAAYFRCRDEVGLSHRPIAQQLGVLAPTPGVGQSEFGRQSAVAGDGAAQIEASNPFGRLGGRRSARRLRMN
jgi:hypothetical protein